MPRQFLASFKRFLEELGAPPPVKHEQGPEMFATKVMRVENVVAQLQADGTGLRHTVHLVGENGDVVTLSLSQNIAFGLQQGKNVAVEFKFKPETYVEPA